jgi:hypothetical protein
MWSELFCFCEGPLIHTAFSANTFDGDSTWASPSAPIKSSILGYNKLVGPVRVSQLRSKKFDCNSNVYKTLKSNHSFDCYGDMDGRFSTRTENTSDFGNLVKHTYSCDNYYCVDPNATAFNTSFRYDGLVATGGEFLPVTTTVASERAQYLSSYTAHSERSYPSPAFSVTLPPLTTADEAASVLNDLMAAKYIDLHTRAIIVELSVYNPSLVSKV